MSRFVLCGLFALVFVFAPLSAKASGLTTLQIQAILSILASFGVDQTIVDNVRTVLTGTPPPVKRSGPALTDQSLVILSPENGARLARGAPITLLWQAVSANSTYLITAYPPGNPLLTLSSDSVTAYQATCHASLTCSYAWTPPAAASSTLTIRDRATNKSSSITVSITQ